jgi:hypothetical protein
MNYMVSHQGEAIGPISLDAVVSKVLARELELFDYIFDEAQQDWVLLMEFSPLADRLKSRKPPRPQVVKPAEKVQEEKMPAGASVSPSMSVSQPTANLATPAPISQPMSVPAPRSDSAHAIDEWYVLKGENRFGPFGYADVIKMLQQKVLFQFDYVWRVGLTGWRRLIEIEEFQPNTVRVLFEGNDKSKKDELFLARKFKRIPYKGPVIVHDNRLFWKGEGFEISQGGVGVKMGNSMVVPGQRVVVHLRKHGQWPALNAACEVVSKKFVSDGEPVCYGLRFLSVSQEAKDEFFRLVS